MRLNSSLVAGIIALSTGLASLQPPTEASIAPVAVQVTTFYDRCMPLADLISKGEGNWNSVNRGRAGDTPGGIVRVAGRTFAEMTIEEVLWLQRGSVYAVGRYQFIPSTLRMAVKWAGLSWSTKFTNETQNKLFCALLKHKRPAIGEYLMGRGSLGEALVALAKEWASIEYHAGRGYYDGIGGNRAHVTRHEATIALNAGRAL